MLGKRDIWERLRLRRGMRKPSGGAAWRSGAALAWGRVERNPDVEGEEERSSVIDLIEEAQLRSETLIRIQ